MQATDRKQFQELLTDAMAFWKADLSTFALSVWWEACRTFDIEQVSKAITAHAMDPEQGRFRPMPADIVKQLQGTRTDRSLIAWGKTLDAMQRVGAYTSVCFDDGLIHAVIEDMGGWPGLCRGKADDLPFTQKRFCDTYKAYATRSDVRYPPRLSGEHDNNNAARGFETAPPVLIGNPVEAQRVQALGVSGSKTMITSQDALAVSRLADGQVRRLA